MQIGQHATQNARKLKTNTIFRKKKKKEKKYLKEIEQPSTCAAKSLNETKQLEQHVKYIACIHPHCIRYDIGLTLYLTRLDSICERYTIPLPERDGTQQNRTELNGAKQQRQDAHVPITETATTKQHHQIMIADT